MPEPTTETTASTGSNATADHELEALMRRADELIARAERPVPSARAASAAEAAPGSTEAEMSDPTAGEPGQPAPDSAETGDPVAAQVDQAEEPEPPDWQPVVRRWYLPIAVGTAALLAGVVMRLGVHWSTLPVLAFAGTAVALAVIDLAILRLPNALVFPTALAVAGALVAQAVAEHRPSALLTELEGGAAVAGFYLLLYVLSRGGLGLGDVKVGAVAGLVLASRDWQHVLTGTFMAYAITLGVAVVMLLRRHKKFPYGPGLLAGTILVLLLG